MKALRFVSIAILLTGLATPVAGQPLTLTTSPVSPTTYGQSVTLTAALNNYFDNGTTVDFVDESRYLGSGTVISGPLVFTPYAQITVSDFPVGTHTLTATCCDGGFEGAFSGSKTLVVNRAPTTTTLGSAPNPSTVGHTVTLTATVSPSAATGTVEFKDGAVSLGIVGFSASAVLYVFFSAGSHSLTATYYDSDPNYAGSTSAVLFQTVNKIPTSTGLSLAPNPSIYRQIVTLTANVSPPAATGNVTFTEGATLLGNVSLSGGSASMTISTLPAGSHNLTATYNSDATYAVSAMSASQTVKPADTSTSLSRTPNPSTYGQIVTLTANVSPSAATGTVTFTEGAAVLGNVSLSGGSASMTISTLTAGNHTLTATYSGDTNYLGSASSSSQSVNQAATSISLANGPNPSTIGQPVTLIANVTPAAATGTVTFNGGATLATVNLSNGNATTSIATLPAGTQNLTASYSGDTNYSASQSGAVQQTVNPIGTATILTSNPNPSIFGQAVTLTASVTPATATGTITFLDGSNTLGTFNLVNGSASFTTSTIAVGTHTLTASYGSDAGNAPSTSPPIDQIVAPAGARTITSLSPSTASAGSGAFTLTVNGTNFSAGARAQWNGAPLPTTFASAIQVLAAVPANLVASTGTAIITVVTVGGTTPGKAFTVNPAGQACSFTLSPGSGGFAATGGSGSILVTATRTDCTWTATSSVPWISFSNGTQTGSGTLNYTVGANSAANSRNGVIAVGAQTFAVTQSGTTCYFSLPSASQAFAASGGSGTVSVTAPAGCSWTAVNDATWVSIAPGGGSGNGTVAVTVAANPSSAARSTTLTIANQPYSVTQARSGSTGSCTASVPTTPQAALEGRTEVLGDLLLNCSGLSGALLADIALTLNVNVTNALANGTTDAVLTVNGGAAKNGVIAGSNILRWPGVSIAPASNGTASVRIAGVRADASRLAIPGVAQPASITGRVSFLPAVPVIDPLQILARAAPSLILTRIQASPANGGAQTFVPMQFQEAQAASFQPAVTRLRVTLTNVPGSVQAYAPIYPAEGAPRAQLYSADASGFGGAPLTGAIVAGGMYQPLTVSNGATAATWVVLAADPSQAETWTFPLLVMNATAADLNQIQYSGSLAPVSDVGLASSAAPVPRYRDLSTPLKLVNLRMTSSLQVQAAAASMKPAMRQEASLATNGTVTAGSNVTTVYQLVNDTIDPTQTANHVTIRGNVPSGQSLISCTATGATCEGSGNQFQATYPSLGAGQMATVMVMTRVDPSTPNGSVSENTGDASANEPSQDMFAAMASASFLVVNGLPLPVELAPAYGTGSSQSFKFQFSHPYGFQNLGVVNVLINNFLDARSSCYLAYVVQSGMLLLVDDAGHAGGPFAGSVPLGSPIVIQNTQCGVTLTSAVGVGTTLTLVVNITFKSVFGGNRIVYVAARDQGQGNSDWQALGVWQAPFETKGTIAVTGVSPARGAAPAGATRPFQLTLTDSIGTGDFGIVNVLVNHFLDARRACYLAYQPSNNTLYLVNDAGDAGGPFVSMVLNGSSGSIENSQCAVLGTASGVAFQPYILTLTLNITFKGAFMGNRVVYVAGRDVAGGGNSDWQAVGTWSVQ